MQEILPLLFFGFLLFSLTWDQTIFSRSCLFIDVYSFFLRFCPVWLTCDHCALPPSIKRAQSRAFSARLIRRNWVMPWPRWYSIYLASQLVIMRLQLRIVLLMRYELSNIIFGLMLLTCIKCSYVGVWHTPTSHPALHPLEALKHALIIKSLRRRLLGLRGYTSWWSRLTSQSWLLHRLLESLIGIWTYSLRLILVVIFRYFARSHFMFETLAKFYFFYEIRHRYRCTRCANLVFWICRTSDELFDSLLCLDSSCVSEFAALVARWWTSIGLFLLK